MSSRVLVEIGKRPRFPLVGAGAAFLYPEINRVSAECGPRP